jgi:hypothetical protein
VLVSNLTRKLVGVWISARVDIADLTCSVRAYLVTTSTRPLGLTGPVAFS